MTRWTTTVCAALALAVLLPLIALADGEEGVEFIGVAELRSLQSTPRRLAIVDVRSAEEFQESHIAGAVSLPLTQLEARFAELPRQGLLVLY